MVWNTVDSWPLSYYPQTLKNEKTGQWWNCSSTWSVVGYYMKNNWCNDCSAGDFEKAHFSCLPDIGEIQVKGLMVSTLLSV